MCMRGDLLPDSSTKTRKSSLHTDSSALLKDTKHKKKVKCPDMKYNKFQMYDFKDNGTSHTATENHHQNNITTTDSHFGTTSSMSESHFADKSPSLQRSQTLENDVKDIRRYLKQLLCRVHMKEERKKLAAEWKIVALVLDRLFFFCYLAAIVISLATIFPKKY